MALSQGVGHHSAQHSLTFLINNAQSCLSVFPLFLKDWIAHLGLSHCSLGETGGLCASLCLSSSTPNSETGGKSVSCSSLTVRSVSACSSAVTLLCRAWRDATVAQHGSLHGVPRGVEGCIYQGVQGGAYTRRYLGRLYTQGGT